ncbi:uncharacterized protein LOC114940134 [Nylanderia fulva]|uniref:uncharacterized protein LOC114940134 n=1 Tax=Nylanderia fulva TaxID=613905 RepID=UPI0010FB11C6|nr:uncharacterized protein LOC114940134 [Nylanderia fulva]
MPSSAWPVFDFSPQDATIVEAKSVTVQSTQINESWDLASKYSRWRKLVRVTAYIFRFLDNCRISAKRENNTQTSPFAVSANEFERASLFWLKTIQRDMFSSDLKALRQRQQLSPRSSIRSYDPFIDEQGLIRVGGRLQNSNFPYKTKHPILLTSHPLIMLLIRDAHVRSLHAGYQLTLSILKQEYLILRARTLVKAVIHRCVTCAREQASRPTQLMGQLPRARVTVSSRAFQYCGVDFAGPIDTRASSGRGIKSIKTYIAVFICLATRAIHLELVGGYSTHDFLNAYTRFCARRGLPSDMYSDNGTNFIGAEQELARAYNDALRDPDFLNQTASDKVSWHFMPPHAPHFGGLWEAGVRSVKYHLRRILGAHKLTFEELTTLLSKIKACLNSRPLGPLTASIDDYESLTPGHFLIGTALTTYPEPSVLHLTENRLSRWQLVRQLVERFWKIWQADYINTLQQRSKWRTKQPSVKIGTMVLLRNATLPPCKWQLGRVIQCFPGSDGLTRVVLVKTATSEYKRPIVQLCILPIDIETQSDDESGKPL